MTTQELIRKVKRIELKTKGLSYQVFSGTYRTTFKGRGMSFSEVRQYQYGDDVRTIDWNVTARSNEPHVKVFEEERELTFMLLLDISGSSFFGTQDISKREFMAEIAASLAFSAHMNNDKVGAIFFSDKIEKFLPPKKGKDHILHIIRDLLVLQPSNKGSQLSSAFKYLVNIVKKRCTSFVLSDFMMQGYETDLKVAAQRHDIVGMHMYDPMETKLEKMGLIPVVDSETGGMRWVDTDNPEVRNNYAKWYQTNFNYFRQKFHQYGADTLSLATNQPYWANLIQFFKQR